MSYIGELSYQDIKNRLLNIKDKEKQLLLTLIFLSGARVGEIVRHHQDKLGTKENKMINAPLKDTDIYIETLDNGKKRVAIKIQVEKSAEKRFRIVYLNYKKEKDLCRIILEAKKNKKKEGGGFLIDISTRTARKWFKEFFPEFDEMIHHLRHWRITAYKKGSITGKKVPNEEIGKIVGHSSLQSTNIYDHADARAYASEL